MLRGTTFKQPFMAASATQQTAGTMPPYGRSGGSAAPQSLRFFTKVVKDPSARWNSLHDGPRFLAACLDFENNMDLLFQLSSQNVSTACTACRPVTDLPQQACCNLCSLSKTLLISLQIARLSYTIITVCPVENKPQGPAQENSIVPATPQILGLWTSHVDHDITSQSFTSDPRSPAPRARDLTASGPPWQPAATSPPSYPTILSHF